MQQWQKLFSSNAALTQNYEKERGLRESKLCMQSRYICCFCLLFLESISVRSKSHSLGRYPFISFCPEVFETYVFSSVYQSSIANVWSMLQVSTTTTWIFFIISKESYICHLIVDKMRFFPKGWILKIRWTFYLKQIWNSDMMTIPTLLQILV